MATLCFATPPTSIDLSYDSAKSSLHVEAAHVSDRLERHYLRRMDVTVNGEVVQTLYYHRQADPRGFQVDVPLEAKPNDVIAVEFFCSEGGVKKTEMTVLPPEAVEEGH